MTPVPPSLTCANLGDLIPRDRYQDEDAYIDLHDPVRPWTWTFGAMAGRVDAVGRGLLAHGYRPGDRIAIISGNRAEFMQVYLGVMRAGLVAVPINFRLPRDTVEYILRDAAVRMAIVDGPRRELVPAGVRVYSIDGEAKESLANLLDPGPLRLGPRPAARLAKILYTSGSTGRPKGVPLDHDGQLWAVSKYFVGSEAGRKERTVIVAPTYHKNGLFFSMVALSNQFTVVSMPRFEARPYLHAVAKYRCTLLSGIPTMFALLARERELIDELDLSSVRTVTIGSAPLTGALLDRVHAIFPGATIQNGYGTTEAGACAFGPHPRGLARPPLALGYPFPDIDWRLVNGPSADQGVLELRTPALMTGYVNLPEVTAARIRDGWYDTGDVMRHDADGFFYFVSRADDMFICGGENIYPGEIEKLLERHPAVAQAAVVPVPDEIKGQIPVAFVVLGPGRTATEAEIKEFALANGPAFAHPRFVVMKSVIPVGGTHKVDRKGLLEEALAVVRATGRS
ncbi:MAG: class I adenylate-forming enzyme family protein [Gemmatimonadota bacterium]